MERQWPVYFWLDLWFHTTKPQWNCKSLSLDRSHESSAILFCGRLSWYGANIACRSCSFEVIEM